mgnify:CR=1 FL=1
MAAKKKRMTQKEKDLNRAWKKEMQRIQTAISGIFIS